MIILSYIWNPKPLAKKYGFVINLLGFYIVLFLWKNHNHNYKCLAESL